MLTYPWKCTVLHCNHLGNTWKPLVLMTRHFDYPLIITLASARVIIKVSDHQHQWFPVVYWLFCTVVMVAICKFALINKHINIMHRDYIR